MPGHLKNWGKPGENRVHILSAFRITENINKLSSFSRSASKLRADVHRSGEAIADEPSDDEPRHAHGDEQHALATDGASSGNAVSADTKPSAGDATTDDEHCGGCAAHAEYALYDSDSAAAGWR